MHFEELDDRYKMLVLYGPSRTGKSRLARAIFGAAVTLVVDIQHADHPDLRGFRRHEHKAILLDEMQSAQFVVANKKVLQAHVDGAILGQSATQLYTYEVFLWRVPIMITTNNWNYSDFSHADRDWIRSNCVEVCIDSPVWETTENPIPGAPVATSPRQGEKRDAPQRSPKASPPHKREAACCIACGQRLPAGSL